MSVNKLLQRVVTPELTEEQLEKLQDKDSRQTDVACHIHECTYGVNSSPLARLALTFSALIHDVGTFLAFSRCAALQRKHSTCVP